MSFYLRWAMSTWLGLYQSRPFCAEWDRILNDLLDRHGDRALMRDLYVIDLGGVEVWVASEYWAYGFLYSVSLPERRPSLRTMRRLDQIVKRERPKEVARRHEFYVRKLRDEVSK